MGQPQEEAESTEKGNQIRPFLLLSTRQMGACMFKTGLFERSELEIRWHPLLPSACPVIRAGHGVLDLRDAQGNWLRWLSFHRNW